MPIDHTIDVARGLLRTFWSGDVSDAEFHARYMEIVSDPNFRHVDKELTDLSQLDSIDLTAQAMNRVIDQTSHQMDRRPFRTAIYAPSDNAFGHSRMYTAYADQEGSETVNVFRSLKEAEAWLFN